MVHDWLSSCFVIHVRVLALHFHRFVRRFILRLALTVVACSAAVNAHAAPPRWNVPDVPPPFFTQSAETEAEAEEDFELRGSIKIAGLAPFEFSDEPLRPSLEDGELEDEEGPPVLRCLQEDNEPGQTRKASAKSSKKHKQTEAGFQRSVGYRAHGVFRRAESSLGRSSQLVAIKGKNGSLGGYGSRTRYASTESKQARLGVQADYFIGAGFLGHIALAGIAGGERTGNISKLPGEEAATTADTLKKRLRPFSGFDLRYYPGADWRLSAGHRYWGGEHFAAAGLQTMFLRNANVMGIAAIEGRVNEARAGVVWASVRFYVGAPQNTLIALQRDAHVGGWIHEDFYLPNAAAH